MLRKAFLHRVGVCYSQQIWSCFVLLGSTLWCVRLFFFFFSLFKKSICIWNKKSNNKKVTKSSHPLIHTNSTHKVSNALTVLYYAFTSFSTLTEIHIYLRMYFFAFLFYNEVILYTLFCILLFSLDMNILSINIDQTQKQLHNIT